MLDPVQTYIMWNVQQPRVREMHGKQQVKGRAYIGAILKRTAAAINDDFPVPVFPGEQCLQFVETRAFMGGPRFDRALDEPGRTHADNQRIGIMVDLCGKLGRRHQLLGRPGIGLADPGEGGAQKEDKGGTG